MAEKIVHGIHRLDIPLPRNPLKNLNSYVICSPEQNLLIDTGFNTRTCLNAMMAELDSLSIDLDKTDIFITHMHADHFGLAAELISDSRKIYMSTVDAVFAELLGVPERRDALIADNVGEGYPIREFLRFTDSWQAKGMFSAKTQEITRLEDGDILEYGNYRFECILTPGHTPGHMCLYCSELKLMFLGDHVLFDITPNIVRWPNYDNALNEYLLNLDKISKYDIRVALPSHRAAKGSVAKRAATLKDHHKRRLSETEDIIRSTPGLTAYQIAGKMHWDIRFESWEQFPPSQKWFAVGETLAHIDYLLAADKVVSKETDSVRRYYTGG